MTSTHRHRQFGVLAAACLWWLALVDGRTSRRPAKLPPSRGVPAPPQSISEPYGPLAGCSPTAGPAVPLSPDPLVRYRWDASWNLTDLQVYTTSTAAAWVSNPAHAFEGASSLTTGRPNITVVAAGSLRIDFGRERAAWMELTAPDLGDQAAYVTAAISEYNQPWDNRAKVRQLTP